MATESSATTVWQGSLANGSGNTAPASGAFEGQEVTWAQRAERREAGHTSPEELLAMAHSSCFSMALSHGLSEAGNEPERIETTATVDFVPGEGVKSSRLVVKARVPGIDQAQFEAAARDAGQNCPISAALQGNVEISVEATLEG